MVAVLIFGLVLLAAVLLSGLAHRSVLSTSAIFLIAGFVAGPSVAGLLHFSHETEVAKSLVELALFAVLFSEGIEVKFRSLVRSWPLYGRALLIGMPLTIAGVAVIARWLGGLSWPESFLVGAVLSPTDPVFASALLGREEVPKKLRAFLRFESGLNDGLAFPFVMAFMAWAGTEHAEIWKLLGEVAAAGVVGALLPYLAVRLYRLEWFSVSERYEALVAFAIAVLVFAVAALTHANLFLSGFFAGITLGNVQPEVERTFNDFGQLLSELLKLGALLVFGALIRFTVFTDFGWKGWVFAALSLAVVRPLSILIASIRSRLDLHQRLAAGWFGPRGFASAFFALLILHSSLEQKQAVFDLAALAIVVSMLLHSSTDFLVAQFFQKQAK